MLKMKRTIIVLFIVSLVLSINNLVFAKKQGLTDMAKFYSAQNLTKEILDNENYIIIDSDEKAKMVAREDLINLKDKREEEISKIPLSILKSYKSFEQIYEKTSKDKLTSELESNTLGKMIDSLKRNKLLDSNYKIDEVVKDFRRFCEKESEIKKKLGSFYTDRSIHDISDFELKTHLTALRKRTAEDAILDAFKIAKYPVSHDLFLHSLVDNPKNLYYQTEGKQAYKGKYGTMNIASSIKYGFLKNPGFLIKLKKFAREGNDDFDKDGYHYEFNNGDLAYSIHGTTNLRMHRTKYDKVFFRIWDVYDFDGLLNKILELTTDTNEYGVVIEGLHNNSIK